MELDFEDIEIRRTDTISEMKYANNRAQRSRREKWGRLSRYCV